MSPTSTSTSTLGAAGRRLLESAGELTYPPSWTGLLIALGAAALLFAILVRSARTQRPRTGLALTLAALTAVALAAWITAARADPALGLVLLAAPVVALLVRLGFGLGPWLSGLALFFGGRIRSGDYVVVGDARGVLTDGDLLRARLVDADGVGVWIPWGAFSGRITTRAAGAPRVARIHVDFDRVPSPEDRRQLEVRAALCPYRVWTRPALVSPDPERPVRLDVELWSWSEEGARLAEDFVRRAVRRDDGARSAAEEGPTTDIAGLPRAAPPNPSE